MAATHSVVLYDPRETSAEAKAAAGLVTGYERLGLPRQWAAPLPGTREYHIRDKRYLLLDQVPDARGMQVLTDHHLERATDLTGWTVEDLGAGRPPGGGR